MEFYGNWGKLFGKTEKIIDEYKGRRKLSDISSSKKLVFEFVRKRGEVEDSKTSFFQTEESVIIEYPTTFGYSIRSLDPTSNVYPAQEFLNHTKENKRKQNLYEKGFFEKIFANELSINIDFSGIINPRVNKFLVEYYYWKDFFNTRNFEEIIIPSAYWSPGIVRAAKDHNIYVSDVQYAMCSPLHPNYGFRRRIQYCPNNIYLWSDYWVNKNLPYNNVSFMENHSFSPMKYPAHREREYSLVILSQTRLKLSMQRFTSQLSKKLKDIKIIYAVHPDDDLTAAEDYFQQHGNDNVTVSSGQDTVTALLQSKFSIGVYSTSLFEAHEYGTKVFILKLPGFEMVEKEINNGKFKLINDINEAVHLFSKPLKEKNITGITKKTLEFI